MISQNVAVFFTIWASQLISLMGTTMTTFAMTIWVFRATGNITPLALVGVLNFGPMMILSPLAGAIVDRWDRRLIMIASDLAAGMGSVCLFLLVITNNLEIWHIYVVSVIAGSANAFRLTAYTTAIALLLPEKHFSRGSSMISMAEPASQIFAPIIAGFLIVKIQVMGILLIDIISFLFAVGVLAANRIPQPHRSGEGQGSKGNLFKESFYGIKYLCSNSSLLAITMVIFIKNLLDAFVAVVQGPLVLVRTNNDANMMAFVLSIEAVGGFAGGLLLSVWGGPKKRISSIQGGILLCGLGGLIVMAIGRSTGYWFLAAFCFGFQVPFIVNAYRTILLTHVPQDIQGRVISSARFISAISLPISMLLGGPLIDYVFEPAMEKGKPLATIFEPLLGSGHGAGMALLYLISGVLCILLAVISYFIPVIRDSDRLLKNGYKEEENGERSLEFQARTSTGGYSER